MSTANPFRTGNRRTGALLPTLIILVGLIVVALVFTNVWTDRMWFDALNFPTVWSTQFWTRTGLFLAFGVIGALIVVGNIWIAFRVRPKIRASGPNSELVQRYRELLESRLGVVLVVVGVLVGLFSGTSALGQVQTFLAWRSKVPFGAEDSTFGLDIGFYVFDYPWWRFVVSSVAAMLFTAVIAAVIAHFLLGALKFNLRRADGSTPAAQAHISVLVGLLVLTGAVGAWLDRYGFQLDSSGLFTGVTYTDAEARITASLVLAIIGALCALFFFANAFVRRWIVPVTALVLMLVSAIILSGIYPAIVQQFTVRPNEPDREGPYISAHIASTRTAYGIDDVEITDYAAETEATAGQLRADAEALPGIRLIDPAVVSPTFDQLQQVRGYYSFPQLLDVDRYTIDDQENDAVVAVRELDVTNIPDRSWNNLHTAYTHGYGMVIAHGNRQGQNGEPVWMSYNMPVDGQIKDYEPRIYFGESHREYSIVGGPEGGVTYEIDSANSMYTYEGVGGVPIGNWFNRLLYALKYGDINILLSERVNPESRIIYDRTPRERVQAAAPWLTLDSNVYPAVVEGRVVWIVDGYTTSDTYPNSQRVSLAQAVDDSQTDPALVPTDTVNYMRNSVKAVVDAYDGTVTLYEWDTEDPVLKTWERAYPGTVQPRDRIPAALMSHLRYPEDMFKVQRELLARYHVTDPNVWFQNNDLWEIPRDPVAQNNQKETPYYLSIKWPSVEGQPAIPAAFSQTTVFVPRGRQNLAAYMAVNAEATSPDYGKIRVLRMADNRQIDGPGQTFNAMRTNETVAGRLRQYLNQGAAAVTYGNLLTLPVGGGLLYVQPVYTQSQGSTGAYPVLTFVMVRFGEHVGIGETLQEALDQVFAGDAGAQTGEQSGQQGQNQSGQSGAQLGEISPEASAKLRESQTLFNEADEALKTGDLGTYQTKMNQARDALNEAIRLMGG